MSARAASRPARTSITKPIAAAWRSIRSACASPAPRSIDARRGRALQGAAGAAAGDRPRLAGHCPFPPAARSAMLGPPSKGVTMSRLAVPFALIGPRRARRRHGQWKRLNSRLVGVAGLPISRGQRGAPALLRRGGDDDRQWPSSSGELEVNQKPRPLGLASAWSRRLGRSATIAIGVELDNRRPLADHLGADLRRGAAGRRQWSSSSAAPWAVTGSWCLARKTAALPSLAAAPSAALPALTARGRASA